MRISDLLLMSISSLWKRKLRTVLTVLGVVIGITSIMVMVALGNGLKEATMEEISQYSAITAIEVHAQNSWGSSSTTDETKYLSEQLVEEIKNIEHVVDVYPHVSTETIAKGGKYQSWITLNGITKEELASKKLQYAYGGDFTSDNELELVYGNTILTNFYDPKTYEQPYYDTGKLPDIDLENGKLFFIINTDSYYSSQYDSTIAKPKKYQFKTAGIMAGEPSDWSPDSYQVYCNIDALKALLKKVYKNKPIPGQPTRKNGKPYKELFYTELIVQVDEMENVTAISDYLSDLGYQTYNDAEWIESQTKQMNMIQGILGAIGAVSLIVAAIGITNTMMMSIYERTKEIGVMKVLGCNIHNIQVLFLLEAGFIGFLGGVVGIILSYSVAGILNYLCLSTDAGSSLGFSSAICRIPIWLPEASIIFAVIIGMVAGFIPSLRAMKLSPLAAIRNE